MQLDASFSTSNCQQKKTRLENDAQLLMEKEIDSVRETETNSKLSFQSTLASSYLKWMQRSIQK